MILLITSMMVLLCSCGTKTEDVVETQLTEEEIQNQAREEVLEKWSSNIDPAVNNGLLPK